jgi:hypothetical protein
MWPESDRARTLPLSLYAGSILSLPEIFSEPGHALHLLEFLFGEQAKDDISANTEEGVEIFRINCIFAEMDDRRSNSVEPVTE